MDNDDQDVEFHPSLEPDVIINDGSSWEQKPQNNLGDALLSVGPDISIIPVRKRNQFKIKLNDTARDKSPRAPVRLITPEEAELSSPILRRKSLPLEKCPVCKKFFRRMKTHLQKHEDVRRDPGDPLTCRFCQKGFNTLSNLSIHMRTHTGDKPYRCEVCSKGFAQSCNLVNHVRIHTGERPYKCPHCERAFTQSGNLSNHIRLHTDEKPFKCHFCEKAFTQSGNLNSHIRNNHKFVDGI